MPLLSVVFANVSGCLLPKLDLWHWRWNRNSGPTSKASERSLLKHPPKKTPESPHQHDPFFHEHYLQFRGEGTELPVLLWRFPRKQRGETKKGRNRGAQEEQVLFPRDSLPCVSYRGKLLGNVKWCKNYINLQKKLNHDIYLPYFLFGGRWSFWIVYIK
jgi:hypothetical protein